MARNLLEKAGRVQVPPTRSEAAAAAPTTQASAPTQTAVVAKPKTAPGTLMGFMANQSEAMKENELLRAQAASFDGAAPTRRLDPREIAPSRWANRHEASFETSEFGALKAEIAQAGGNVQPIKVRPLGHAGVGEGGVGPSHPPPTQPSKEGVGRSYPPFTKFEIVFGHRRHRACLELGLPVLALVEDASEQELFVQMERENRNRADLSAWEQGMMYAKALDQGLYASNRQLAAATGRDLSDIGKTLALARLPRAVIDAFVSPLDLQFRWAKPLSDLQQSDPDGVLKRAKQLSGKGLSGKQTFEALMASEEGVEQSHPRNQNVVRDGVLVAVMNTSRSGRLSVKFAVQLSSEQQDRLRKAIEGL